MKRFASIITGLASLTTIFWFHAAPNGEAYCQSTPYTVSRQNTLFDRVDTLAYQGSTAFCGMVKSHPRPVR